MVFFVLIPAVPAVLGNFAMPLMIGAKDVAFPKLNLLSWYIFTIGFIFTVTAMVLGGVDTGWTFYTPYSSLSTNTPAQNLAAMAFDLEAVEWGIADTQFAGQVIDPMNQGRRFGRRLSPTSHGLAALRSFGTRVV